MMIAVVLLVTANIFRVSRCIFIFIGVSCIDMKRFTGTVLGAWCERHTRVADWSIVTGARSSKCALVCFRVSRRCFGLPRRSRALQVALE
jgi:hypothetical protein